MAPLASLQPFCLLRQCYPLGHTYCIPNQHVKDPKLMQVLITDLPELFSFASAEPTFGGNTINPIGVILWLVHAIGILAMSAF